MGYLYRHKNIDVLVGQTLSSVERHGDESIVFTTTDGKKYRMLHEQDCCESVVIDDVCGNLDDLVGSPILQAEESTKFMDPLAEDSEYNPESYTWTFYRIATQKGQVVIRWYGTSNGYYSEQADFIEETGQEDS